MHGFIRSIAFSLLLLFVLATDAGCQRTGATAALSARPDAAVRPMDGWKHETLRGIDSTVGRFVGERGFEIRYDAGGMAGNWAAGARKRGEVAWSRKQVVNGLPCEFVMTTKGRIIATFPEQMTNFFAEAKSPEDVADFMLLAMTFSPPAASPRAARLPPRGLDPRLQARSSLLVSLAGSPPAPPPSPP